MGQKAETRSRICQCVHFLLFRGTDGEAELHRRDERVQLPRHTLSISAQDFGCILRVSFHSRDFLGSQRKLSHAGESLSRERAILGEEMFFAWCCVDVFVPQTHEEEEEELDEPPPPPPPIASRPERTKSIYTKPVEEEGNANGAPLDRNRNPQPAAPPSPVGAGPPPITGASPISTTQSPLPNTR